MKLRSNFSMSDVRETTPSQQQNAVEKVNVHSGSEFFVDLENEVLKLPFCETVEDAIHLAVGISDYLPERVKEPTVDNLPRIFITTTGIREQGSRTRDTAVVVLIPAGDTPNVGLVHSTRESATVRVVAGFRENPDIFWDPETVAQATLDYQEAETKRRLAAATGLPLAEPGA
jgi:hypothetical protein